MTPETYLSLARQLRFVRESSARRNDGPWVEAIQRVTGNKKGDAWCASFVSFVLTIAYGGENPLPTTASCDVLLRYGKASGTLHDTPQRGDVFLLLKTTTDAIHTGFVSGVRGEAFTCIEGNTNPDGSREGYGVFARERKLVPGKYTFLRVPHAK